MLLRQKSTTVFRAGLVFFLFSTLVGYFAPRTHLLSEDWLDGIHGMLLGISIGLMLLGLIVQGRGTGSVR